MFPGEFDLHAVLVPMMPCFAIGGRPVSTENAAEVFRERQHRMDISHTASYI